MVANVMQGYNACCLAYGQTGAGKTHTILGDVGDLRKPSGRGDQADAPPPGMGLAPRLFRRIFEVRISAARVDTRLHWRWPWGETWPCDRGGLRCQDERERERAPL